MVVGQDERHLHFDDFSVSRKNESSRLQSRIGQSLLIAYQQPTHLGGVPTQKKIDDIGSLEGEFLDLEGLVA